LHRKSATPLLPRGDATYSLLQFNYNTRICKNQEPRRTFVRQRRVLKASIFPVLGYGSVYSSHIKTAIIIYNKRMGKQFNVFAFFGSLKRKVGIKTMQIEQTKARAVLCTASRRFVQSKNINIKKLNGANPRLTQLDDKPCHQAGRVLRKSADKAN